MVLGFIGVLVSAALLSSLAEQKGKKANPRLNATRFDADNARYGVSTSSVGFTRQKIMDIAARCGVKPNKYGMLPEDGWKRCLKYVEHYINDSEDIVNFERDWRMTVADQLQDKSSKMIKKHWKDYQTQYKGYLEHKEYWTCGPAMTLEFRHWHGLLKDEYLKRLDDLQNNTFWGELVLQDPILRKNSRFEDSFIEVWVIQGGRNDSQDRYITKNMKTNLYIDCLGVCGYDAML